MLQQLLSTRYWHISDSFLDQVLPIALTRLELGKDLSIFKQDHPERSLSGDVVMADRDNFTFRTLVDGKGNRVALIPLYGTMTKYGGLCSYGTAELAEMVKEANRNKSKFKGIVFDTDTPGGASNSIEVLDRVIEQSALPVVGWVDTMACSAGQWVMSSIARKGKILVDSLTNTTMGSIGAYCIHQNVIARLQASGIKVEIIRAPQSKDKARFNNIEELTQELRKELEDELRELVEDFKMAVSSNYGDSLKLDAERLFTGGTFNGTKSIEIGLAHDQGELSDAFELAVDMANTRKRTTTNFNSSNMSLFKRLGLSIALAQKLTAEELEQLGNAEERLSSIETERDQLSEENGALTTRVEALEASLEEANGTIETHEETISERDSRITELENAAGATSTTVVSEQDPESVAANQKAIDDLPHNKAADSNPLFNGSLKEEDK
ncbi:hypothetical protein GBO34_00745 [Roseivirga pacifica]|uniref:S49 family peptidase n=1 Tax=Roseivirga pacifica TaxID=1267423 RepID=UPI002094F0BC|nr:S49 family peptidase [Roseivirga pacifica]MCO6367840.1 hypothetical protein [Roseivirga pacifica]MCO6377212.1 hypothetical protein [Roseivirga pacifica]